MIIEELKKIIINNIGKSDIYIRNTLKEYLQVYVLNFIYTDKDYNKKLIFTGGTCLRHCFELNRLSEDLNFDLAEQIDIRILADKIIKYFKKDYLYKDLQLSIKQRGYQLLLKFPILKELGFSKTSESDLLYVKIDLEPIISKNYEIYTTLRNRYGFNYIVTHYDLPSLMAGKIAAILNRKRYVGINDREIIKGRDYFDLLWFLEKEIKPNIDRINDLLKKNYNLKEIIQLLDEKVHLAVTKYKLDFKRDLQPFIENVNIIDGYINGFEKNYEYRKRYL